MQVQEEEAEAGGARTKGKLYFRPTIHRINTKNPKSKNQLVQQKH